MDKILKLYKHLDGGIIDTLQLMIESIQLGSSTAFLLPKDVKMSGDISGIAVQLTQSQDIELALHNVIEWQNVADFKARFAKLEKRLDSAEGNVLNLKRSIYQGYRCKYPEKIEDCPVLKEYEKFKCNICDNKE